MAQSATTPISVPKVAMLVSAPAMLVSVPATLASAPVTSASAPATLGSAPAMSVSALKLALAGSVQVLATLDNVQVPATLVSVLAITLAGSVQVPVIPGNRAREIINSGVTHQIPIKRHQLVVIPRQRHAPSVRAEVPTAQIAHVLTSSVQAIGHQRRIARRSVVQRRLKRNQRDQCHCRHRLW